MMFVAVSLRDGKSITILPLPTRMSALECGREACLVGTYLLSS